VKKASGKPTRGKRTGAGPTKSKAKPKAKLTGKAKAARALGGGPRSKRTSRPRKPSTQRTLADLRERLHEAEATLDAIRSGQVDALVVQGPIGDQVFTLKGADHRYRQLVETMNEGALLLAADGTIVYGNARFARLVKVPLEKMIGAQIRTFVTDASLRSLEALLQRRGGSSAKAELDVVATDGEQVPVYLSATDSWSEDDQLTCVIATDLAEQKRSQEIVAADRLAALILDQAAEGIVVCDVEGRIVRASQAADRVAGRNTLLQRFEDVFALSDDDGCVVGRVLIEAALGGGTMSGIEATLQRGAETHVLLLSAGPIQAAGKERGALGCVVSFVDITDRKRSAEERLVLLEQANAARLEAEAASRAKDQFLAMLGHELRNPLAPIVTALQLMRLRSDETFRAERAVIERQVKHVVTLVDDLLDISRITRGKIDLDRQRIDLMQVVGKAIELASPLIEGRAHQLEVDVPAGLWLDGDEIRLAQVVANLLTNAAKYTPKGGHIKVRGLRQGNEVVTIVHDDGVGIPPEIIAGLFEMFVQGKRTIDRSEGGLGLGLAIVRSLVSMHGGSVTARSAGVGQGSEFEVRLPAAESQQRAAAVDHQKAGPHKGDGHNGVGRDGDGHTGLRILIVDDNGDSADDLAARLVALGHEARVAYDGATALAVAAAFAPDVALLEIALPQMSGFELAQRLRSETAQNPPPQLIALSGYRQTAQEQDVQRAGFAGHLIKPIAAEALAGVIGHLRAAGPGISPDAARWKASAATSGKISG
jgi:PAS domain S-box-containing protein